MRSIHRHGLLGQALLMLGVVGLPPPPTREQLDAEALAETERVKVDLEAAGLSVTEVAEAVGPERFAKVGRLLLALQKHRRSLGQWALWHANEARRVTPGDGWVYGPRSLAKIIGNAARLTRSAADACALLDKTRANLGLPTVGGQ